MIVLGTFFFARGTLTDGVDAARDRYFLRKKAPGQIDHRIKNARFIGELVKFRVRGWIRCGEARVGSHACTYVCSSCGKSVYCKRPRVLPRAVGRLAVSMYGIVVRVLLEAWYYSFWRHNF